MKPNNAFVTETCFYFKLVNHILHRFLRRACSLVRPSLVLKALIIRHDTSCFLDAIRNHLKRTALRHTQGVLYGVVYVVVCFWTVPEFGSVVTVVVL